MSESERGREHLPPPPRGVGDGPLPPPPDDAGSPGLSSVSRRVGPVVINAGERAVRAGDVAAPAPPAHPPSPPGPVAPPVPPVPPVRYPQPGRRRAPRPRVRAKRLLLLATSLPLLLAFALVTFAWVKFGQIPRVPVWATMDHARSAGTNWLIVGSDSRDGFSEEADAPAGARTDTIMVLRTEAGKVSMLSIPRDLWVKDPKTGQMGRINGTFNAGPSNLVDAVQALGIPVHHYMEIDFVGFGSLVDAVGGIDVDFPLPARDTHSGLYQLEPGTHTLGGEQALAYVRSRYFEELKNGRWQQEGLSDLARVGRQRTFLTALMRKVSDTRNPFRLGAVADSMSDGLRIDDGITLLDAVQFGLGLRGVDPASETLPTVSANRGGASVLDLDKAEARPVIARYAA